MKQFKNIILGGTFDLLHDGHKALIAKAFELGEKVWIGITSDRMCQVSSIKCHVGKFEIRENELKKYLKSQGSLDRAVIIKINDKYGTTLIDRDLEAIVISPETKLAAQGINCQRRAKNWPILEIIEVPWILGENDQIISSKCIRSGQIDRHGRLFRLPKNWGKRFLPENLRNEFKKPMGELIVCHPESGFAGEGSSKKKILHFVQNDRSKIIAVGDATVANFLKNKIIPDISIVDLQIQRVQIFKNVEELGFRNIKLLKKVNNPHGTLSIQAQENLLELLESEAKPVIMQVNGEDDLLALLAIFLAPLNYLIVYGQPNKGIVVVEITEEKKLQARKYLAEFICVSNTKVC